MTVDEVFDAVVGLSSPLITITGGEPLLQSEVYPLVDKLLSAKYRVLVETNGSLPVDNLPRDAVRVLDLKCPGSGMCEKMDWNNIDKLRECDEVKFVIGSRADYDWAKSVEERYGLSAKMTVLMSAAWGKMVIDKVAGWMLADDLNVRIQPQLHRYIDFGL